MNPLLKYTNHLPNCNMMQDWSEADQALSDTPTQFRDADYYIAVEELNAKKRQCTCGLNDIVKVIINTPSK